MNRKLLLLLIIISFIIYRFVIQKENSKEVIVDKNTKVVKIANSYIDVSYKAGGTTKKGMDCSGLTVASFKQVGVELPRSSKEISKIGKEIRLKEVEKGDLLFFDIARLKGGINHVGIVTSTDNGEVLFIHSTTSKGVIISSMNEFYWKEEFVKAKRVF